MKNIILFLSLLSIVSCNNNKNQEKFTRLTRGSVEILDERGKDFVSENSRIELLVDSLYLLHLTRFLFEEIHLVNSPYRLNLVIFFLD